ncbi:methyltransferase domain-containing protein [Hydrotalea sp.]|uniref:methyltransferase domain-containing protein n=3 Tax=Hydrotalea sp. TaxID=2881279 RepID=UPI00262B014E|nr:methyltransferase domain-containing protein [Hydrotalea sp.]
MKLWQYISYFWYIAINWNIKIAWFIVKNEWNGEKKYGIQTIGYDELNHLALADVDINHASIYMPVDYTLLEIGLNHLQLLPVHFVDFGCGKGRSMCVAAHFGFINITGIELSPKLYYDAQYNITQTQHIFPKVNFHLINNDAFYISIPSNANCLFFYNPFDEIIIQQVILNIDKSLQENPRNIEVIYITPMHKNLFLEHGYTETFYQRIQKYMEISILQKNSKPI